LTPLLLSSGSDRPLGLFGYLLLLDSGFLLVARRRGWSVLMGLALVGTLLIEAAWVVNRMGVERQLLGVGIVALFGLVFAVAGAGVPRAERPREESPAGSLQEWSRNQAAGLLLPFGFALYFASQARFDTRLVPIALLLGVLSLGASWVAARTEGADWLPLSAAVGCVTVVGVWLVRAAPLTPAQCWDAALSSAGLGLVFHVGAELRKRAIPAVRAAATAELGLLMVLIAAAVLQGHGTQPLAWLCGWVLLGGLLALLGRFDGWGRAMAISATLLAIGLNAFWTRHESHLEAAAPSAFFAIQIALAFAYLCLSALRRRRADHAAALIFPSASLLGLALSSSPLMAAGPGLALGATSALGAIAIFAATHLGDGRALVLGTLLLALAQYIATWRSDPGAAGLMLALLLGVVVFISAWPHLRRSRLAHPRWEFYSSALAGPLWFLTLRRFDALALGASVRGLLPMTLAGISLMALWCTRRSLTLPAKVRHSALAWYAAVALGFLGVAIPLQLDRHWISVGWAIQSAAVLLLFRRLDHAGLKWLGVGLGCVVTVRLVLFPEAHADAGTLPFLNWLLYAYGVPALALFGAHVALRDVELERLRPWEDGLYRRAALRERPLPLGAYALGLGVVAVVFAWINLSIVDAFAGDARLAFDLARQQTRDLCLSLGWACYAGALLTLGMRKRSKGLRWLSLGLFILTIGKVFLHDLGQLEDLYQVLSLLGLAFSLIAVSLAYQRFVFGKSRRDGSV
jgi:uncharacterized membrane protein